jgi:hypothetical protein
MLKKKTVQEHKPLKCSTAANYTIPATVQKICLHRPIYEKKPSFASLFGNSFNNL